MTDSIANILLVDDDAKSLMAMGSLLEGPGRLIIKAQSGHEALRHLLRTELWEGRQSHFAAPSR